MSYECSSTSVHLPGLIRLTGLGLFVPSAIRIMDTTQAAVIPVCAHGQVYLSDAVVGRHVQGLVLENNKTY